ncbi:Centromere protein J, partial [Frankliniella fusca]
HKNQSQPILDFESDSSRFAFKDANKARDDLKEIDMFPPPAAKLNLSIIPEADEDSRSRNGDGDTRFRQEKSTDWNANKKGKTDSNASGTFKPTQGSDKNADNPSQDSKRVVKKPFLRRGQGLVKYKLQPEDLKKPYRSNSSKQNTVPNKRDNPKPISIGARRQMTSNTNNTKPITEGQNILTRKSKTEDVVGPMHRLVLSIPSQKSSAVDIGTWSQVFTEEKPPFNHPSHQHPKEDISRTILPKTDPQKSRGITSPLRKVTISKSDSSPEEDQESLAAYLDLEQHVGNASFCSTSSKVDRLVSKSSKLSFHQSNPDAITQSKQLSPVKTGRKFFNSSKDANSISEDHQVMWSVSDLENLIKSRARRSGSLIKPSSQESCTEISGPAPIKAFETCSPMTLNDKQAGEPSQQNSGSKDIEWVLEALGPARRPHLMKTMPSIDLDSSLVKNALCSKETAEKIESDSDSSSSDSSSEEESEEEIPLRMKPSPSVSEQSSKVMDSPSTPKEIQKSPKPFKLMTDATLEEINKQIESHLSELRKEIETLQSAKNKTQKYTASLEKKVQELESRLLMDTKSFHKRLDDEREAASKRLSEELAKFSKEKQALQRTLREERRKAPDPITHQELLRLKQEISDWEEKWRTDRAKARGLESNLRIQITNLKKENEKLREENSKLRREKETAVSTAKAKASSNTRVINSIAQQLASVKPKVKIVREENSKAKKQSTSSAYNLKSAPHLSNLKSVATIENFPNVPSKSSEWSTDEEVDLGKETSDDDDGDDEDGGLCKIETVKDSSQSQSSLLRSHNINSHKVSSLGYAPFDLVEAQAKYDAIFGKSSIDSDLMTKNKGSSSSIPPSLEIAHSSGNNNSSLDTHENEKYVKSICHPDGKVEQSKENGTKVITHPDGTWTRHSSSGSVMTVPPSGWPIHISYFNGDQLEKLSDGTTRYFYAKTNVWQTTYPDGQEELKFPNGQVEQREKSGLVKVILPEADVQSRNQSVVTSTANGISVEKLPNGNTVILLPNGEKELHTNEYMRKDFLDGTVKFIYKDGSQETRYPSGRIRIKDSHGNLIKDTGLAF